MEKQKSKKKLIAIIAGAAMAFVLTVVVSVAATLAYFGETKNADNATITMGQALEFTDAGIVATVDGRGEITNAIPGTPANIKVARTVAESSTKAFFVVKLSVTATPASDELALPSISSATCTFGGETKSLKVYDGQYLYIGTTEGECDELTIPEGGAAFEITITYKVPTSATNNVAESVITVTASASIIQSQYLGADGATTNAIATVVSVLPAAA